MSRLVPDNRVGRKTTAGRVLLQEAAGGVGRIRSPMSHQIASPGTDATGKPVLRTANGQTFRTRKISP